MEPYPGPERPKPQKGPKESKPPKKLTKESLPKTYSKCKGNHDEKYCTKFLLKEIEKETPPPKDSRGVPKEDRKDLRAKVELSKWGQCH